MANNALSIKPSRLAPLNALLSTEIRVKIVDIGASLQEGAPLYARMVQAGNADVVGFEPNPVALAELNAQKGPHETYLPYAVGDGARHKLRVCVAPGMTSLLEPNPVVLDLFHGFSKWGRVLSTVDVDTVCLDDVAETAGVDLLKMDIQGAELMVLNHARQRLKDATVIHSEVQFLPMYKGQPLFSEIELFLRQCGFVFHMFFPLVSRVVRPMSLNNDLSAGLNQVLGADAIFVKDFSRVDVLPDRQLLAMAAILHDCYQSIDLVLLLLGEYDRRHGTVHARDYVPRMQAQMGAF